MDVARQEQPENAGFRVTTVAEFLGLSPEESELVEIKVALSHAFKQQRSISSLSQSQLAERIGSSPSRIAKMEAGDAGVSLDLLIRALLAQGMTRQELADVLAGLGDQTPLASASNGNGRRTRMPRGVQSAHEPSATERRD